MLVAVSYRASERERAMFEDLLSAHAELIYLKDVREDESAKVAAAADVLLGWNPARDLGPALLREFTGLRLLQLVSAGADLLDPGAYPGSPLLASNAGAFSAQMAEHVLAMVLALQKRLLPAHLDLQRGVMDQSTPSRVLRGSTVGIIGYGGIGRAVRDVFRPFGCPIMALNRSGDISDDVDFRGTLSDLGQVLSESDVIVLTLPLTPATTGLIGRDELSFLKEKSIFINVARAAIVDEDALYAHLVEHPGVLAGLDVWWQEPFRGQPFSVRTSLLELPNLLGSPHNSGVTEQSHFIAAESAARNVLRFLRGEELHGVLRREDLFAS